MHSFVLDVLLVDAADDILQGHLHVFFLNVHECWHQLRDLDLLELRLPKFFNRFLAALVDEDANVAQHCFMPLDFFFDFCDFSQRGLILLLADVMHDYCVVPLDQFGVFNAFINLAVGLENLENCFFV